MKPTILTADGSYYNFLHPESCHISASTIAHALSHICRFTGHTRHFYSVAQHSVLVSRLVPPEHALAGLLHDAAEAYLGDVATPLKQLLPEYKAIEARVEACIFRTFDLTWPLAPAVKQADLLALYIEQRDLLPAHDDVWPCETLYCQRQGWEIDKIEPLSSAEARLAFLLRFEDLLALQLGHQQATDWSAA